MKEKTIEEQLRDMRISKDDPKALKRKIEELESKVQELEHKNTSPASRLNIASSREEICPTLKREAEDGRIEVVNGGVTCEYSSIDKYYGTYGKKYSTCKVNTNKIGCPYTDLLGKSEVSAG